MKLIGTNCWIAVLGIWGVMSAASVSAQSGLNEVDSAIVKREFGTASKEMDAVEKEIANTRPEQYGPIEARMIAVLEAPGATLPGRQFACQMLRTVGSSKCIPAVSQLLTDEKLSHMARRVFLGMHDPAIETALRNALAKTQGTLRIGLLNTIGDRGDRSSLTAVAAWLNGDEATVRAALNAVGKIGGVQAAELLEQAKVPEALRAARAQALLVCAGSLAATGDSVRAEKLYRALFEGDYPMPVRAAAFGAMAKTQKERAVPLMLETLNADNALLRRAAAGAIIALPGSAAGKALAQALAGLNTERKIVLLGVLAARGEAEGLTATVNKLAVDENPALRTAAINALARLGDASSIPVLAGALKDSALASKITPALVELQGRGVVEALLKQAESGEPTVRQAMLGVLAERLQAEALPVVRKSLKEDNAGIREASLKTLSVLGVAQDFNELAGMILTTREESEREQVGRTMSAIGDRLSDKSALCEPVLQALAKADEPTKICLLTVLTSLGGERALQAVRASLAGPPEVRKTAVRALADWPDAGPMADLLEVAKSDADKSSQVLALRGYIRMIGMQGGQAATKLQAYRQAMDLAGRPDEKRLVLAGLADVPGADALKMAEAYLDEPALKREAFLAYERIAESLVRSQPAVAKEALQRVQAQASDAGPRNRAKRALDRMK
jgi:HEAT repeat protein